jgi:branched-chain amino acid transport system permease protein
MAWFDANLVSLLDGLAIGALLFMMAVGLSLIFGLMDVLNLAHGTLFLLGAYLAYQLTALHLGFVPAALIALAVGGVLGWGFSHALRPIRRRGHLDQAVLTLGIALIGAQVFSIVWGDDVYSVAAPIGMGGSMLIAGHDYPVYRLLVIGVGTVIAIGVYLIFQRTNLGATVRAAVADQQMVEALGVNTRRVLFGVFAAGAALACFAGVIGSPILGPRPGLDDEVLLLALIVVVIGGLGSIVGVIVGAIIVGEVQSLGVVLLPQYASFLLFVVMALILVLRPAGILGHSERRSS